MNSLSCIFFGSTTDSVIVLEKIFSSHFSPVTCHLSRVTCHLSSIVTQPPAPIGRKQIMTQTPVEIWAKEHHIPVCSFETHPEKPWLYKNEEEVTNTLSTFKPDLLISACYGQKIPQQIIDSAQFGGLNVHPSLLPRWRGADPVPWAMLMGDEQTGVTIVTLSDTFDQGKIISQKKINITDADDPTLLRTTLFSEGADLLIASLPDYVSGKNKGKEQKPELATTARKLSRKDGFISWEHMQAAMEGTDIPRENRIGMPQLVIGHISLVILRMIRSLSPWPGVWTYINPTNNPIRPMGKRLKILEAHTDHDMLILDTVQLEGKKPVQWSEFKKSYM